MGKPARRSVANNPSTPFYDTYIVKPKIKVGVTTAAPDTVSTTHKIPLHKSSVTSKFYSESSASTTSRDATNSPTSSYATKTPEQLAAERAAAERERQREEFYATYDVMTGVRIAATLGCFFAFMVFLIAYKSRNKDEGLNDPDVAATTATLVQEEEEREEQEAWEATQRAIYEAELDLDLDTCENRSRKRPRLSLGTLESAPVSRGSDPILRFSSIGGGYGYSGLVKPPFRRYSAASFINERYRRGSVVGPMRQRSTSMESPRVSSASYRVQVSNNSGDTKNYYRRSNNNKKNGSDSDGDEADDEFEQITVTADINHQPSSFLSVPKGQDSRRSSGLTCCSTESSFLERRCSAMSLGISSLPGISRRSSFRDDIDIEAGLSCGAQTIVQQRSHTSHPTTHIHPEIEVIKATPRQSPNISSCDRQSMMELKPLSSQQRRATITVASDEKGFDYIAEYPDEIVVESKKGIEEEKREEQSGKAPLASLSSFKLSSADNNDSIELQSLGSDTVFDDYYADTEDDMDPLTTDSDQLSENDEEKIKTTEPSPRKSILKNATTTTTATSSATATDSNNKCTCDSITVSHSVTGSGNAANELIIVSDSRGNKIGILPRFSSNSISIINTETFETKAIIERHDLNQQEDTSTLNENELRDSIATVKFPITISNNPDEPNPCGGSDTNLQKHRAKKFKKIQEEEEKKRPASTIMNYSLSTLQKKLWGKKSNNSSSKKKPKDSKDPESDNSNDKSNKLSKTKANNKKPSQKSTKECDTSTPPSTTSNAENTESSITREFHFPSRSTDATVVVRDLSPCVVLELPILAAQGESREREEERQEQELASNKTLDPDAPSPSRKWSRETLF
uniref:CSON010638 protein n=1 Tax=Culicoides sonorensis TaxID=179676 RepID=A0A336M2J8_CULSO